MRLTKILMATILALSSAWGQAAPADTKAQQPASTANYEAEIIHVKTLTGDSFNRLASILSVFDVKMRADENLRTIVVYGPKDVIAQMRRVVTELDMPGSEAAIGRNIEMTMTLLRCSMKAAGPGKLPDDIEPVAKQLRAATQYKDIQVWDVIPFRLQEGREASVTTQLSTAIDRPAVLNISLIPEAATRKGQNWSVRFRRLNLEFKIPMITGTFSSDPKSPPQFSYQSVGLNTAGDFLEGQKTVLGKVSGSESDSAIFAVISLKVLE